MVRPFSFLLSALPIASLLTACSGAIAPGTDGTPAGSGTPPVASTPAPAPGPTPAPSPTSPGPDPAPTPVAVPDAALAALLARCHAPTHGPVDPYASFGELKTRLVGRWFSCAHADGKANGFYALEDGIEFDTDGTWHFLRRAGDGTFTTLHGIENEGTWHEKYTDFLGYFQVNHPSGPNGMILTEFAFETTPREMRTSGDGLVPTWLVPMGAE